MTNKWLNYLLKAILAIFLQILILNGISFYGLFSPKIYPIFLLMLPWNIKPLYHMLIGFIFGGIIDLLSNTQGIGMAASVFICFIKPYIFKILYNKTNEDNDEVSIRIQGKTFVFSYLLVGLLLFHLYYFFTELGEISNFFYILFKTILSSLLVLVLYIIFYLIFVSVPRKK